MQDLTTGSVTRHLLKTTGFMLVTMVFQTLYFLVDLYWVGRLGKEAVAGVAIAGNLTFIVLAITQMLGVGITTLVSHAAGQKDRDRARLVFNQSLVLSALVGVLFSPSAMALRAAVRACARSADARPRRSPPTTCCGSFPPWRCSSAWSSMGAALRGTGNFKPGMVVQTATVILNIVLAPFLIFGWGTGRPLGVAGAAIASLVAIAVGIGLAVVLLRGQDVYLTFVRADWKPQIALWRKMLGIGLPAGAEFALVAVYLFVVYVDQPAVRRGGAGRVSGSACASSRRGFMPVVALGFAVAPVAGQNFGARQPQRVRDTFQSAALMAAGRWCSWTIASVIAPAPR